MFVHFQFVLFICDYNVYVPNLLLPMDPNSKEDVFSGTSVELCLVTCIILLNLFSKK